MFTPNSAARPSARLCPSNWSVVARSRTSASWSASARTEAIEMAVTGFGEIAERLRRSTVLIHAGGRGNGSGLIWSSGGVVLTNAHVARSSRLRVQLWDGREFHGVVTSRDPRRDLAALRIDAPNLQAAAAANSSQLRPGELAI